MNKLAAIGSRTKILPAVVVGLLCLLAFDFRQELLCLLLTVFNVFTKLVDDVACHGVCENMTVVEVDDSVEQASGGGEQNRVRESFWLDEAVFGRRRRHDGWTKNIA